MNEPQQLHNTALEARRRIVCRASLVLAVLFAVGAGLRLSLQQEYTIPYPVFGLALVCLVNGVWVARGGSVPRAGRLLIAMLVAGMAATALSYGGIGAPSMALAPLIPVLAILVAGSGAAWVVLAVVAAVMVVLFAMGMVGWIPTAEIAGLQTARLLALLTATGLVTWIAIRIAQLAERLLKESWEHANVDHLTGVATRRAFEAALMREVGSVIRHGQWLTIAMADVDHFKRYNDRNGHQAGDRCLIEVAANLTACANRPLDLVGRYGGEEFIVLLPDTDPEGARQVGERMRAGLAERRIPVAAGSDRYLTMTVGMVTVHGSAIDSISTLVGLADEALYEGKAAGRDQVVTRVVPMAAGEDLRVAG